LRAIKEQARIASESATTAAKNTEHMINSERAGVVVSKTWPANIGPQGGDRINDFKFDLKNCGRTVGRLTGPYLARFHLIGPTEKLPDVPDYRIDPKLFGGGVREKQERELQFCYRYYPGDGGPEVPRWELSGPKEYNKHS
jgi:hypothetical protein